MLSFFAKQLSSKDVQEQGSGSLVISQERIASSLSRALQWIAFFNVVTFWRRVCHICFEGCPGDIVFIVDFSSEEGAFFVDGSSVDEFFNVVNEQKIINSLWRFGSGLGGSDSY